MGKTWRKGNDENYRTRKWDLVEEPDTTYKRKNRKQIIEEELEDYSDDNEELEEKSEEL